MIGSVAKHKYFPAALGIGSLFVFVALLELLIRVGMINRFIVPMPSDIIAAFPRVIVEEHVLSRFLLTAGEVDKVSGRTGSYGINRAWENWCRRAGRPFQADAGRG